jgi:hypothetical protein
MTFPQPNSEEAVADSLDIFRLKTQLQSPGDMYESKVSCHAVAIGPDSDIASVNIFYYDPVTKYFIPVQGVVPQVDTSLMASAVISPDRPFIGRIDAQNTVNYPLISRPGRILFASGDVVDPNYLPAGFNPVQDSVFFEPIYLDIVQYLSEPPSLVPQRSDKTYRYQYFTLALIKTGSSFVVIPAYGRKSGSFQFVNRDADDTVIVHLFGVRLSTSNLPGTVGSLQQELFSSSLAPGDIDRYTFDSSTDGIWDCFYIELEGYYGGVGPEPTQIALPVTVTLSDDAL